MWVGRSKLEDPDSIRLMVKKHLTKMKMLKTFV